MFVEFIFIHSFMTFQHHKQCTLLLRCMWSRQVISVVHMLLIQTQFTRREEKLGVDLSCKQCMKISVVLLLHLERNLETRLKITAYARNVSEEFITKKLTWMDPVSPQMILITQRFYCRFQWMRCSKKFRMSRMPKKALLLLGCSWGTFTFLATEREKIKNRNIEL